MSTSPTLASRTAQHKPGSKLSRQTKPPAIRPQAWGYQSQCALYKQVNRESLTAEAIQRLVERADADKLKKAVEQLKQLEESSPEAFPGLSKYFLLLLPASVFLNKVGGDPQPSGVETGFDYCWSPQLFSLLLQVSPAFICATTDVGKNVNQLHH